jgi:hypothetical protein
MLSIFHTPSSLFHCWTFVGVSSECGPAIAGWSCGNDATAVDDLMMVLPAACLEVVSKGEIPEPSGGFRLELRKTRMEPTPALTGARHAAQGPCP